MIRIQLRPAPGRRLFPALLLGTGVLLAGLLGFFLLDRPAPFAFLYRSAPVREAPPVEERVPAESQPPAAPLAAEPEPAVEPPGQEVVQPPETQPPRQEPVVEPPRQETVRPRPALPVEKPRPAAAEPPPARDTPLCLQALRLHEHLPAVARCTALNGNSAGEYSIEGAIPGQDVAQLYVLLDVLQRLPSKPNLSFWREGRQEGGDYRFAIHGQFTRAGQSAPLLLDAEAAAALVAQAADWARQSRLDSVRVGAPMLAPLAQGRVQHRRKLWATGSYAQLRAVVERVAQTELGLDELVLVPIHKDGAGWKLAQMYVVLSAVVSER